MCAETSSRRINLALLAEDPARVELVPVEQIPALLSQLSALQGAMAARLVAAEQEGDGTSTEDALLTVDQASARLGVSKDWLYRRTGKLPFTVRLGRHVRYSAGGIDRYVRQRAGR
jgi:excisionase family DNA binding protein